MFTPGLSVMQCRFYCLYSRRTSLQGGGWRIFPPLCLSCHVAWWWGHYSPCDIEPPPLKDSTNDLCMVHQSVTRFLGTTKIKQQQPFCLLPLTGERKEKLKKKTNTGSSGKDSGQRSRAGKALGLEKPLCFGQALVASWSANSWQCCSGGLTLPRLCLRKVHN